MPETVLRGPGTGPAIDDVTGRPLTMEELLRRRGFIVDHFAASPQAPTHPSTGASSFPSVGGQLGAGVRSVPSAATTPASLSNQEGSLTIIEDVFNDPEVQEAISMLPPEEQDYFWQGLAIGAGSVGALWWLKGALQRRGLPVPAKVNNKIADVAALISAKDPMRPVQIPIDRPTKPTAPAGASQRMPPRSPIYNDPLVPQESLDAGLKRTINRRASNPRANAVRRAARARK